MSIRRPWSTSVRSKHTGIPTGAPREIAESDWFGYGDRARASAVDQMVFDALHTSGQLP